MLLTVEKLWSKFQEFMGRIAKTETAVEHLDRKVEILEKGMRHQEKIQDYQGKQLVEAQQEIKQLKTAKHGLATKLGKQKAVNDRLISPQLPLEPDAKKSRARKH
jgi:hypothetical protein